MYFSGNDYNSHCQYLCTVGFVLKGDDQRLCKADGRWTGDRPHCEQVSEIPSKTRTASGGLDSLSWI